MNLDVVIPNHVNLLDGAGTPGKAVLGRLTAPSVPSTKSLRRVVSPGQPASLPAKAT